MINPHVIRKTTNPVDAPPETGIHWINTVTGEEFFSVDVQFVADWVPRRDVTVFIGDEIVDGQTSIAPSQNAVFDALALKVDKSGTKVLSDNNYTTSEKTQLSFLQKSREVISTVSSAGTLVLTINSEELQIITGTTTHSVTLPAANGLGSTISQRITIKNRSTSNITINRTSTDIIEGLTSIFLTQNQSVTLRSNGSNEWVII